MAIEREANAITEAVKGVLGLVRGELAAVWEELARQNERVLMLEERNSALENEVNESRRALGVVGESCVATAAAVEKREMELAAVRGELVGVKGELTEHKAFMIEQLDMAERRRLSDLRELREEARKREGKLIAELAREREERRSEIQELNRAMEELAACKDWVKVELEISQRKGHQKTAWERIKSASRQNHLRLSKLHSLSDDILDHASTMTHLTSISLDSTSGFTAEGIKHLYRLPRLEMLNLNDTDISDSALEGIGSLTSLKQLYLWKTKVTDVGLRHLRPSSSSRKPPVTEDGLQQLAPLTKLTTLLLPQGVWVYDEDVRRRIGCQGVMMQKRESKKF